MINPAQLKDIAEGKDSKPPSQATALVELAIANATEFFHDQAGEPYVRVRNGGNLETWPLRTKGTRAWLSRLFFDERGQAANSQAQQDAISVLDGLARFNGDQRRVHVRLGEVEGDIYLDLGGPDWTSVWITPDGWNFMVEPPVRFRRTVVCKRCPGRRGVGRSTCSDRSSTSRTTRTSR